MNKNLLLLSLAFAVAPSFGADLLQVYRDAIDYDAQFASAKAAWEAGQEKLPQGRAGLLPVIGASASTVWNDVDFQRRMPGAGTVDAQYNTNGYQLTLTQPIFRWQNIEQYRQGKLAVAVADAQFSQAKQDLVLRVSQAYFDVLLAQDSLDLAQAQKKAISEQLEAAKRNFEVGTATITDTHEAQARHDLATAQELAAQNDLEIKRHALRQVIGKVPDALARLRPQVQLQRPQPDDMAQMGGGRRGRQSAGAGAGGGAGNRRAGNRQAARRPPADARSGRHARPQLGLRLAHRRHRAARLRHACRPQSACSSTCRSSPAAR
ncbi:hypothetical protein MASR1M97_33230 [Candidatus Desulfobacillus denitrificans]